MKKNAFFKRSDPGLSCQLLFSCPGGCFAASLNFWFKVSYNCIFPFHRWRLPTLTLWKKRGNKYGCVAGNISWKSDLLLPFLPDIVGRIEVPTTGLRDLFCVCLLCKRNRNLCSWYPTGVPLVFATTPRAGIRMEPQLSTHWELGTAVPYSSALTTAVTHPQLGSGLWGKEHKEDSWWAVWKLKTQAPGVKGHTRENKAPHSEWHLFLIEKNWRQKRGHMTAGIPPYQWWVQFCPLFSSGFSLENAELAQEMPQDTRKMAWVLWEVKNQKTWKSKSL